MVPYYRALNKMNRNDIAFAETKLRYANMLKKGATTTWEYWELTDGNQTLLAVLVTYGQRRQLYLLLKISLV